tara:strand:- start:552 stop:1229 length:678 start_codon:yes stop_codon:yes gene_type:complete
MASKKLKIAELSQAEQRRQRFLQNKEEHEGNFYSMLRAEYEKDVTVYFLEDGTITGVSKEDIVPLKDWKSFTFSKEQTTILDGKNLNNYRVAQNPDDDKTYHIELRPVESLYVRNEDTFVQLIEYSKSRAYDLKVGFKQGKFVVQTSAKTKKKYKDKDIKTATAKGHKELVFYFTSVNDPHFLIYFIKVQLADLLEQGLVYTDAPKDLDQCSVYTLQIFDKYVRT